MALGAMAVPAYAAANPASVCGSGYSVIDSHRFQSVRGTVYLLYSAGAGKNCVVTIADTAGKGVYMEAGLQVQGARASTTAAPSPRTRGRCAWPRAASA